MEALDLSLTNLEVYPSEITNLSNLKFLNLRGTTSTTLPDIENLTNLESLSLAHTEVGTLPPEVINHPHIRNLYLDKDQILTWASVLSQLPEMNIYVDRSWGQAAGTEVPKEILAGDENDLSTWLDEHPF